VLTKTESSSETGTSSSDYDGIEPVPQGDHRDRGLTKSSIEIEASPQASREEMYSLMVDDGVTLVLAKVLSDEGYR
jgi:hypothetical protein